MGLSRVAGVGLSLWLCALGAGRGVLSVGVGNIYHCYFLAGLAISARFHFLVNANKSMHPVPYYYTRPRVRSYSPNQSIVKYIGIGYMWRSVGNGYMWHMQSA